MVSFIPLSDSFPTVESVTDIHFKEGHSQALLILVPR